MGNMKSDVDFLLGAFSALSIDLGIPDKDRQTILKRGRAEGLTFFTVTLPTFSAEIIGAIECGHWTITSLFGHHNSTVLPKFLGGYLCKLFDCKTGVVLYPTIIGGQSLYIIRQICEYAYKADFGSIDDTKGQSVIDNFIATDTLLEQEALSCPPQVLVLAHELIRSLFYKFSPDLSGDYGPGICSDSDLTGKHSALKIDSPALRNYHDSYLYEATDAMEDGFSGVMSTHASYFNAELKSKVILVPKDSRGPRLICCEPTTNQWIQMSLMRSIYRHVEAHELTAGSINFTSQDVNRGLVKVASINRNWSTIDLKDASDRVRLDLFKFLFNGTSLLGPALACRTNHYTTPDGTTHRMRKFAPMGSALCFPIMALTIWAILSAFISLKSNQLVTTSLYVYGDDIIVPQHLFTECCDILESVSLRVNKKKSFDGSYFRESCGADYYFGVNVTPIRLRKPPTDEACKKENSFRLITHLNEVRDFTKLATYYQSMAEAIIGKNIAYSASPIPGTIRVDEYSPLLVKNLRGRVIVRSKPKRSIRSMSGHTALALALRRIGADTKDSVFDADLRVKMWSLRKIRVTEWRPQ